MAQAKNQKQSHSSSSSSLPALVALVESTTAETTPLRGRHNQSGLFLTIPWGENKTNNNSRNPSGVAFQGRRAYLLLRMRDMSQDANSSIASTACSSVSCKKRCTNQSRAERRTTDRAVHKTAVGMRWGLGGQHNRTKVRKSSGFRVHLQECLGTLTTKLGFTYKSFGVHLQEHSIEHQHQHMRISADDRPKQFKPSATVARLQHNRARRPNPNPNQYQYQYQRSRPCQRLRHPPM